MKVHTWLRRFSFVALIGIVANAFVIDSARADLNLDFGWKIAGSNGPFDYDRINFIWRLTPLIPDGTQTLEFSRVFHLSSSEQANLNHLILPTFWGVTDVILNGEVILDEGARIHKEVASKIYMERIIRIHGRLLKGKNEIVLIVRGDKLFAGFRGNLRLTEQRAATVASIYNYIRNHVGYFFAATAFLIFLLCTALGIYIRRNRLIYLHLGVFALGVLPYNLLLTDVYKNFTDSAVAPFTFQLLLQVVAWPAITGFFVLLGDPKSRTFRAAKAGYFLIIPSSIIVLIALSSMFFDFQTLFEIVLYPALLSIVVSLPFAIFSFLKSGASQFFKISWLFAFLMGICDPISDLVGGDIYLIHYTVSVLAVSGFFYLVSGFIRDFHRSHSLLSLSRRLIPEPVFQRIENKVDKGQDFVDLVESLSGQKVLTILIIDVCGWGKMTDDLPREMMKSFRRTISDHLGKISEKYHLSFIKTNGDSLMFVGGLSENISESDVPNLTAAAIVEMIDSVPSLWGTLKEMNLPRGDIKISASIGLCDFEPVGFSGNYRFDIESYWVISAKRQEEAMNTAFYNRYGKNCALISVGLFRAISDLDCKRRFHLKFEFQDKHKKHYSSYIAFSNDESVPSKEVFMKELLGEHGFDEEDSMKKKAA